MQTLVQKRDYIQKFIELKNLAESNPNDMVNGCAKLLQEVTMLWFSRTSSNQFAEAICSQ